MLAGHGSLADSPGCGFEVAGSKLEGHLFHHVVELEPKTVGHHLHAFPEEAVEPVAAPLPGPLELFG